MADSQMTVASEVIVPDPEPSTFHSPSPPSKRRQSLASDGSSNKRLRLTRDGADSEQTIKPSSSESPQKISERRANGDKEELKRGKRLFGALLGTLAQSSSSTAHRRRVDIERKQQEKLKLQTEEHDELKKQRLDALMEIRRREQKKYNKQSMQIRHSNLLATAQFLKTEAEPHLYYKPWELLPNDEAKIKSQIEEAETIIEREVTEHEEAEARESKEEDSKVEKGSDEPPDTTGLQETVGPAANNSGPVDSPQNTHANLQLGSNDNVNGAHTDVDGPKESVDDGGEVLVEGVEDTVIY